MRMPAAEGGGIALGLEHNTRSGIPVPLQLNSNHHHHHQHHHHHHQQQHYDAEYSRMESWLDEHQDFAQDYFIRKATRNVIDTWLVAHATPSMGALTNNSSSSSVIASADMMHVASPTHVNQQQCSSSRSGSGATTPVR